MIVRMELISDTIFGSGMSVPGGEDIGVLVDRQGFPYYKGSSFRGILREEAENYAVWLGKDQKWLDERFGKEGTAQESEYYISVTDFELPLQLRNELKEEDCNIQDIFTSLRTFTSLDENGVAAPTTLRMARCVNKGFVFYGSISCHPTDVEEIKEILSMIRFVGTMRTRGFGQVRVRVIDENNEQK